MSSTGSPEVDLNKKKALVNQILELQNTLEDLSQRVESVRDENIRLRYLQQFCLVGYLNTFIRSENGVLGKYIEQLMAASPVFHSSTSKAKN